MSVVLLPMSSSAMFQSQASVWQALNNMNNQPTTFDVLIEGTVDNETFSVTGSGQGEGTSLNDAKALFNMQLMATDAQMGNITANVEFKLVDQVLYIRGNSNQPFLLSSYGISPQQWLAVPLNDYVELDAEMEVLLGNSTEEMEALMLDYMPRIFTMESQVVGDTYEYTLTPKPGYMKAVMELGAASLEMNGLSEDIPDFSAEAELFESMLADILEFKIVVRASKADEVINSNVQLNVNDENVQMSASLTTAPLQFPSLLGAQPVGVQIFAPAKRITRTLNDVYNEAYTTEEEWNEEVLYEEEWDDSETQRYEAVSNEWSQMEVEMAKEDAQYFGRPSKRSLRASVRR